MHAFEGNILVRRREQLASREAQRMLTLRDLAGVVQPLKIAEIHRKSIFYEPWFQILISCKTLQLIEQVVSVKSVVLSKSNPLLLLSLPSRRNSRLIFYQFIYKCVSL